MRRLFQRLRAWLRSYVGRFELADAIRESTKAAYMIHEEQMASNGVMIQLLREVSDGLQQHQSAARRDALASMVPAERS